MIVRRPLSITLAAALSVASLVVAQTEPTSAPASQPASQPAVTSPQQPKPAPKVDGKLVLQKFVGSFSVTSKSRGSPDSPWTELRGEEVGQSILNDRFVQSVSSFTIGDEKHFNLTLTGFDRATQQFSFTSMGDDADDMLRGTGTASDDGARLELKTDDGLHRFVINFDAKGYGVRLFAKDDQGNEFLASEDRYERK